MSITKPVRDKNAIDEIAFVLQFKSFFTTERFEKKLFELYEELQASLPEYHVTNGIKVQISTSQEQSLQPDKQLGIVCYKPSTTNPKRQDWSLRVDANRISVICSDYTSWKLVSQEAKKYLDIALKRVHTENNPIIEIVYQCIDKFICKNENINFSNVFNIKSELLNRHITKETPEAWHIHQGWFENLDSAPAKLLHNLNINMHHKRNDEKQSIDHEVIVSHLIRIQNTETPELKIGENFKDDYLNVVLDSAHNANKKIVKKLLSKDMLKAIGLQDE